MSLRSSSSSEPKVNLFGYMCSQRKAFLASGIGVLLGSLALFIITNYCTQWGAFEIFSQKLNYNILFAIGFIPAAYLMHRGTEETPMSKKDCPKWVFPCGIILGVASMTSTIATLLFANLGVFHIGPVAVPYSVCFLTGMIPAAILIKKSWDDDKRKRESEYQKSPSQSLEDFSPRSSRKSPPNRALGVTAQETQETSGSSEPQERKGELKEAKHNVKTRDGDKFIESSEDSGEGDGVGLGFSTSSQTSSLSSFSGFRKPGQRYTAQELDELYAQHQKGDSTNKVKHCILIFS